MAIIGVKKQYRAAAEAMAKAVKNSSITFGTERDLPTATVKGLFQVLDPFELDMWGGEMEFVFRGKENPNEEEHDADFYAMVGHIAAASPALAAIMTSDSTLQVFQEATVKTETVTSVTKKIWVNGRLSSKKGERGWDNEALETTETTEVTEKRDITEEWAKRAQKVLNRSDGWGW